MTQPVATEHVDILGALRALLNADPDIAAATDGRVFAGELPTAETGLMPRGCIVLAASGGPSITAGSHVEADTQRVDVNAYAGTPRAAAALANMAVLRLRRIRREVHDGVLIHWAQSAGGFSNARDPDFDWPRAFASMQIFHALIRAS